MVKSGKIQPHEVCYNKNMYTFNPDIIDAKFSELLATVEDNTLRAAMRRRLKRNSHLVAGAILVDEKGKICLVQEAKGPWAGKWNLPLGHLEHGETMPEAAKREVKEETGYDIKLSALLPLQNASCENVFRILYIGKVVGGSPEERIQTDTSAVDWFTVNEIQQKFDQQELRDAGVWHDILLYHNGPRLPLDIIKEVEYKEL